MSETEPTREELEALRDMTSFERRGALLISERAVICLALEALDRRAELATLTAQVAEQAQEIAAKETMIAATDAEAAKALLLLTDAEAKLREQAQEIERLRREWEDAVEREGRLAPSLADTQMMARDAQAKLRAVEALRDEANAALLTAYRALASIHGDAEDCDDCGTIAEAGEDGCRIHTGTRQARLMWEAVEAIEDTLGPCWCGHTRAEHNDCDERICEAKDCTCRCFKLSKLTAMLTLSSKESAT